MIFYMFRCLLVNTSKPDILSPGLLLAGECYSNAHMLYVGIVCKQINGESFALYIQERKKGRSFYSNILSASFIYSHRV